MNFRRWMVDDVAPASVILVRLLVGWVFFSEGVQKFLFPAALGVGRFEKIGIPTPHFFAPFVGVVETVCGLLLILGLLTRVAAVPLLIDISVAIATTKIPMLAKSGFWGTMHEARTDICMFLGSIFLIAVGSGRLSLDAKLSPPCGNNGINRPHCLAKQSAKHRCLSLQGANHQQGRCSNVSARARLV